MAMEARAPNWQNQQVGTNNVTGGLFRSIRDEFIEKRGGAKISRVEAKEFAAEHEFLRDFPTLQRDFVEWLFTIAGE